jgi:hypothetical protein
MSPCLTSWHFRPLWSMPTREAASSSQKKVKGPISLLSMPKTPPTLCPQSPGKLQIAISHFCSLESALQNQRHLQGRRFICPDLATLEKPRGLQALVLHQEEWHDWTAASLVPTSKGRRKDGTTCKGRRKNGTTGKGRRKGKEGC